MADTYNTELSLLYSQLSRFPTDDELELVEALAYLVEQGEVSVWLDDDTGQVLFQHITQEILETHGVSQEACFLEEAGPTIH
jgi:hypothetical protein